MLTDGLAAVEAACREAGAGWVTSIKLHLRPGVKEHYMGWLKANHPELEDMYERLYRDRAYLPRSRRPGRRAARRSTQPQLRFG